MRGFLYILLFGLFGLVGLVTMVAVAVDWVQGLDTWFWEEATCVIESSEAATQPSYGEYDVRISYRYDFRGGEYAGDAYRHGGQGFERRSDAEVVAARYPVGSEVRCWVDPEEPGRSYLRRADLWEGLWIFAPLLFVAVGVGGIWLVRSLGPRGGTEEPAGEGGQPQKARSGFVVGGLVFLFGVFFLFGTGFFATVFVRPALQVVAARAWDETACEVVSSRVRSHPGDDSTTYSIDVLYRYEIGGREYRSNRYQFLGGSTSGYERKAAVVEALAPGATTTCWVDPNDPFAAVIERGFTSDYLFGLVPLLFALIGVGGLVFAVGVMRGARKDAARSPWAVPAGVSSWVGGSSGEGVTVAAGPMVLEPIRGPFGKLGCAVVAALLWNGFISLFVWHVVQEWRVDNPQWGPALILTPFVLIGLLLLSSIPYSILALLNPRPRLHLSPGLLTAGGTAHLEWAFRGAAGRVRRLRIWLEATERRTHQTGSGFRIETSPLDFPPVQVLDRGAELPLDYGSVSFTVPPHTPPSSDGEPAIHWRLKLHGEIGYWPDVLAEFEVEVLPTAPE